MAHEQVRRRDQLGDPPAAKRHGAQLRPLRLDSGKPTTGRYAATNLSRPGVPRGQPGDADGFQGLRPVRRTAPPKDITSTFAPPVHRIRVYGPGSAEPPAFPPGGSALYGISRRHRNKSRAGATAASATAVDRETVGQRDHMARVHVDDQTWAAFKQAAGPVPISELLGQLVTKHVDREAARRLRDGSVDDRQLLDALEQARELHANVAAIVARLEWRLNQRAVHEEAAAAR
jgi:hypothetical protein